MNSAFAVRNGDHLEELIYHHIKNQLFTNLCIDASKSGSLFALEHKIQDNNNDESKNNTLIPSQQKEKQSKIKKPQEEEEPLDNHKDKLEDNIEDEQMDNDKDNHNDNDVIKEIKNWKILRDPTKYVLKDLVVDRPLARINDIFISNVAKRTNPNSSRNNLFVDRIIDLFIHYRQTSVFIHGLGNCMKSAYSLAEKICHKIMKNLVQIKNANTQKVLCEVDFWPQQPHYPLIRVFRLIPSVIIEIGVLDELNVPISESQGILVYCPINFTKAKAKLLNTSNTARHPQSDPNHKHNHSTQFINKSKTEDNHNDNNNNNLNEMNDDKKAALCLSVALELNNFNKNSADLQKPLAVASGVSGPDHENIDNSNNSLKKTKPIIKQFKVNTSVHKPNKKRRFK